MKILNEFQKRLQGLLDENGLSRLELSKRISNKQRMKITFPTFFVLI